LYGSRNVLVGAAIAGSMAAGAAVLSLWTDLPLFVAFGVWIAPLVVLIPYAYPQGRRAYGLRTVVAALAVPAVATAWVVWLFLTHGQLP
jgi:hypothetical protein